jgi:transcription elongation factor
MILPKIRDPRFITLRRGGFLSIGDHRALAIWAAECAERVLPYFEAARPGDVRPRRAVEQARAWARGESAATAAKVAAYHANAAARGLSGAAKFAALSAGQAAVVAHVAAHELGAAAYAIRAAVAAAPAADGAAASAENGRKECAWQQARLAPEIRDLVLDDEKNRNGICWNVFSFGG